MTEEIQQLQRQFAFVAEDCRRHFGEWDICDPVSWAILRVVQAQNDFSHAIHMVADYGVHGRALEAAIAERSAAIAALQQAIEKEPRGFQPLTPP